MKWIRKDDGWYESADGIWTITRICEGRWRLDCNCNPCDMDLSDESRTLSDAKLEAERSVKAGLLELDEEDDDAETK